MTDAKRGPKNMTDEHKEALNQGRKQSDAVRTYLTFLNENRRVWSGRSVAEIQKALSESTDPMERLRLRPQLRAALEAESVDSIEIVQNFVKYCAAFSERLGITYADWREEGVPAAVLRDAGLKLTMKHRQAPPE